MRRAQNTAHGQLGVYPFPADSLITVSDWLDWESDLHFPNQGKCGEPAVRIEINGAWMMQEQMHITTAEEASRSTNIRQRN